MIYEFRCEECNKLTVESLPVTSTKKVTNCDYCEGKSKRIISKNTFILKGGGWEKDGYTRNK